MTLFTHGRVAAAGLCAAMMLAGTVPGAEAKGFKVLHAFSGADGNYSVSPLYLSQYGTLYGTTELGGNQGAGSVFSITPGGTFKSLYSFLSAPDGASPEGGVAVENSGAIYGSTYDGGPESLNYPGTIYKISPKGKESVLYNFCQQANCADGVNPNSTLVADDRKSGFVYGTTHAGGNGWGTLFQITTDGQMNPAFYTFCQKANCADGSSPLGAPFVYNSGLGDVVYGVTSTGGANGYGIVYSMDYNGNYFVLCNFDYTHGAYPQGGVILDPKSNIIGVAGGGGSSNGVVYKLRNQGGVPNVLYTFTGGTDGAAPIGELVQDPNGNLYGVTSGGGTEGQGTVYKLSPKGVETVLHSFDLATDGGVPLAGLYGVYTNNGLVLYGTTSTGGLSGDGTIFKIQP